ncbi:MAG: hypothetical protein ACOC80_10680 [Petrotogales bacterium]
MESTIRKNESIIKKNESIIKKNKIILLSKGEYSDYEIVNVGIVLKTFDIEKIRREYSKKYCKVVRMTTGSIINQVRSTNHLINWLIEDKKLIKPLGYYECFLDYYGNLNLDADYHEAKGGKND